MLLAQSVKDGEYHRYDMGTLDFHSEVYVWFGTAGVVDPKQVKAIHMGRFIFGKE